nr:hypothetical protein [uncultured Undibacterium sp.]
MTDKLTYQRIRNRLFEIVEWIIESDANPPSLGFNALINYWDDWTNSSTHASDFPAPIYSANEGQLLVKLGEAIDTFCKVTPQTMETEVEASHSPEWKSVLVLAHQTYEEMMKRGRLSEVIDL